jgi:hypothetical protein
MTNRGISPGAGENKMQFSAYDNQIRVLSSALSDALEAVLKSTAVSPSRTESLGLLKRLSDNLLEAFDRGEREHSALKCAALRGMLV